MILLRFVYLGTAIKGPLNLDSDFSSFFHFDTGGMSSLKGPPTKTLTSSGNFYYKVQLWSLIKACSISFTGSALPPSIRVRLYELFVQIEHEFEVLYTENLNLQERVEWLTNSQPQQQNAQRSGLSQNKSLKIDFQMAFINIILLQILCWARWCQPSNCLVHHEFSCIEPTQKYV